MDPRLRGDDEPFITVTPAFTVTPAEAGVQFFKTLNK